MKMLSNFLVRTQGTWDEETQLATKRDTTSITRTIRMLGKSSLEEPIPIELVKASAEEIMEGKATSAQISAFLVGLAIHGTSSEV